MSTMTPSKKAHPENDDGLCGKIGRTTGLDPSWRTSSGPTVPAPVTPHWESSCALRSDYTEAISAKHRTCPHLAVHGPPDSTLEMGAAEMGAPIRCPVVGDSPRGTETANRSPPAQSRGRPHPVASDNGMAHARSRIFPCTCHPRLVNGYRRRTLIPITFSDVVLGPSISQVPQNWPNPHRLS